MELVELSAPHNITTNRQHRELPVDVPDSFVGMNTKYLTYFFRKF